MSSRASRKSQPFISGYCAYAPHQAPCKGEFENGSLVKPRITLCSCSCHGDYEARRIAAGQGPQLAYAEDDEDENE